MSKKIILSTVLATSLLLVSCGGRDDDSTAINNQGGGTTIPAPPNNSTPTPPSPQNPPQKPADSYMGTRMGVQWKSGVSKDILYNDIDIAELINNKEKFTAEFFKKYVSFYSSEPNGNNFYTFNDEDIKNVQIHDLTYEYGDGFNSTISFRTSYKGTKSDVQRLRFSAREFYESKFLLNTDYISQNYMRGIYELGEGAIGHVFKYDENRYEIDYNSHHKDDYNNTFDISFTIIDKNANNKKEVSITKNVKGFKTLKHLADNLTITTTTEFDDLVKSEYGKLEKRYKEKAKFVEALNNVFINRNWIQNTKIKVENTLLTTWRNLGSSNHDFALYGQNAYTLGIYLELIHNRGFVITDAILQEKDLHITIQLRLVNDVPINKDYKIVVKNVK